MTPAMCPVQAPVPPPSYHRAMATALHLDALTLVTHLHLRALFQLVRANRRQRRSAVIPQALLYPMEPD